MTVYASVQQLRTQTEQTSARVAMLPDSQELVVSPGDQTVTRSILDMFLHRTMPVVHFTNTVCAALFSVHTKKSIIALT